MVTEPKVYKTRNVCLKISLFFQLIICKDFVLSLKVVKVLSLKFL